MPLGGEFETPATDSPGDGGSAPIVPSRWPAGLATRQSSAVTDDDDLWDRLSPEAGRGSSGKWTSNLGGLPIARGGFGTEAEALEALRAAHREALSADADYCALAVDMAALPAAVQRAAHTDEHGETTWRIEAAVSAIQALAEAGRVVLGLDVREYAIDGTFTEAAWSSYEPTGNGDPEAAGAAALEALSREHLPGEWILVTWRS